MVREAVASDDQNVLGRPLEHALGKRTIAAPAKLELRTVGDLPSHAPFRLTYRGELTPLADIREGRTVTAMARVMSSRMRSMNSRRGYTLTVRVIDDANELDPTFFSRNSRTLNFYAKRLVSGVVASFSGTVSSYRGGLQLTHPEYELVGGEPDVAKIACPIPIYHAMNRLSSRYTRKAVRSVLRALAPPNVPNLFPGEYLVAHRLPSRFGATHALHCPEDDEEWRMVRLRVAHEEAYMLQVALARRSHHARERVTAPFPLASGGLLTQLDADLSYELASGQEKVSTDITTDLAKVTPMRRLLQSDVGSGKTVVAPRAMFQVFGGRGQAALLAPTEVLAYQHMRTIEVLVGSLAPVKLLMGSLTAAQRRRTLACVASDQAGFITGTHTLFSDDVAISFLGLAVVDEQRRLGVDQRDALAGGSVHTLVITATPIPRTIAMSVFDDLDVSVLREPSAGHAEVSTTVVPTSKEAWVKRMWECLGEEARGGGRAYAVRPHIEDGDEGLPLTSVANVSAELREKNALAGIGVGTMHGHMSSDKGAGVMESFASGRAPIFMSTTVVEVGIGVPEATTTAILDANHFDLSQLHQLCGRIGRGTAPGACLTTTSAEEGSLALRRPEAFASTTNGFTLAELDLQLRNGGDVLGAAQVGRGSHLRFLSVAKDREIIETARAVAHEAVAADPRLVDRRVLAEAVAAIDAGRTDYLERGWAALEGEELS